MAPVMENVLILASGMPISAALRRFGTQSLKCEPFPQVDLQARVGLSSQFLFEADW
jgi:hypothetical protein